MQLCAAAAAAAAAAAVAALHPNISSPLPRPPAPVQGYATLDLLLEAALAHLQVAALGSSPWAASLLWRLAFDWGGFELRGLARLLRLARSAYGEARRIIVAPDALLLAAGGPGLVRNGSSSSSRSHNNCSSDCATSTTTVWLLQTCLFNSSGQRQHNQSLISL